MTKKKINKQPNILKHQAIPLNRSYFEVMAAQDIIQNLAKVLRVYVGGDNNLRWVMDRYTEMHSKDAFIGHCINLRINYIKTLENNILCDHPSKLQAKKLTSFIQRQLYENIDFDRLLRALLDSMIYGFSCIEKLFELRNGKWELCGFNQIFPGFLAFNTDYDPIYFKDGCFIGSGENLKDKRDKFAIMTYQGKCGNPYGTSLLNESIFFFYLFRKEVLKNWYAYVTRYGQPILYGKFPQKGINEEDIDSLVDTLGKIRSGYSAVIPDSMDIIALDPDLDKSESSKTFLDFWKMSADDISNNILFTTMSSENDTHGSYSKNRIYQDIQETIYFSDALELSYTINSEIIKHLIDINFGVQEYYPYLAFNIKETKDLNNFAKVLVDLQKMGLQIPHAFIQEYFGVPEPTVEEGVLKPLKTEALG